MLICDGHDSHITGDFIEFCMDNNILLMILPPHSSHLTQPLDVGVFGALKKHHGVKNGTAFTCRNFTYTKGGMDSGIY